MKLKLLGFISLLILSLWLFWDHPQKITINDSLENKKDRIHLETRELVEPIKIPSHAAEEKNYADDSIPWIELEKRWARELKDKILSVDPEDGEKRFNEYQKKKQSFADQTNLLMSQRNETYSFNEQTNEIVFKDKKKYQDLNLQIDNERKILAHHTRLIFGDFYTEVRKFHQEFEQSMQAYNNTEGNIGIDPAFGD